MALRLPLAVANVLRKHYQASSEQPKVVGEEVRAVLHSVISEMADILEERGDGQFDRTRFVASCHGQGGLE